VCKTGPVWQVDSPLPKYVAAVMLVWCLLKDGCPRRLQDPVPPGVSRGGAAAVHSARHAVQEPALQPDRPRAPNVAHDPARAHPLHQRNRAPRARLGRHLPGAGVPTLLFPRLLVKFSILAPNRGLTISWTSSSGARECPIW